ncbi:hypothetical protein M8R20_02155 [Pseudomonas sp. R2.Fl]|nr:hypothetical protein [Pseudomonas sp. R2.Fl]
MFSLAMRKQRGTNAPSTNVSQGVRYELEGQSFMGKSIALFFACAALVIIAGSFVAPTTVAAKKGCAPAYGVDPCSTGSIAAAN